jgi:hypothetical protein
MEESFKIPIGKKEKEKGFLTIMYDFFIVAAIFFSILVSKFGMVPGYCLY